MSETQPLIGNIGTGREGGSDKEEAVNNLLAYISFLAPIIVTFGVLFFSVIAGVIGKGSWYILWLIIATVCRMIIIFSKEYLHKKTITLKVDKSGTCNKGNFLPGSNSTYSLFVLAFTFVYFTGPMIIYNNTNIYVIIFFLIYIIFDILIKVYYNCINTANPMGAIGDLCGGIVLGIASVSTMFATNKNFLFINEIPSNKEICSMPSEQTFKCSVYKNGQLISSSNIN